MKPTVDFPIADVVVRYMAGESTPALARAYGVAQVTVWRRLNALGVKMRACGGQLGNGNARKRGGPRHNHVRGYIGSMDREGKPCLIHRACWEAYCGVIPGGHVIHHRDGNRRHNEIGNLACVSRADHVRIHESWKSR